MGVCVLACADAAVAALRDNIAASLSGTTTKVIIGWPDGKAVADLCTPMVTVYPTNNTVRRYALTFVRSTPHPTDPDLVLALYKTGFVMVSVQVDLWAPYKGELQEVAFALEGALAPEVPFRQGVGVTMTKHYDGDATFTVMTQRPTKIEKGSLYGEWRNTYVLEGLAESFKQVAITRQTLTTLDTSVSIDELPDAPEDPFVGTLHFDNP